MREKRGGGRRGGEALLEGRRGRRQRSETGSGRGEEREREISKEGKDPPPHRRLRRRRRLRLSLRPQLSTSIVATALRPPPLLLKYQTLSSSSNHQRPLPLHLLPPPPPHIILLAPTQARPGQIRPRLPQCPPRPPYRRQAHGLRPLQREHEFQNELSLANKFLTEDLDLPPPYPSSSFLSDFVSMSLRGNGGPFGGTVTGMRMPSWLSDLLDWGR